MELNWRIYQLKTVSIIVLLVLSLTLVFCKSSSNQVKSAVSQPNSNSQNLNKTIQGSPSNPDTRCLVSAYPDFLDSVDDHSIKWKDGSVMPFDDGKVENDFETMLNHATLKDQMSICYPKGDKFQPPPSNNNDPGRPRFEPFFLKMYGNSQEEVRKSIVPVIWLPKHLHKQLMVTTINGVDQKIRAISDELDALPDDYVKYLANPGGTFNWRVIAGTQRQSTHSFGMTIDINVAQSDYWRNFKPDSKDVYSYRNRIPSKIVEIFEKYGFIWGGKWYHFDTMHFEYRPELLRDECICK